MVRAKVASRVDRCLGSPVYEIEVSGAGFSRTVFGALSDFKAINQCPGEAPKRIPMFNRSKALVDERDKAFAKALDANLQKDPTVSDKGLQHFLQMDGTEAEADAFLSRVRLVPWGVLGMQQGEGEDVRKAPSPDAGMAIVDPAGLHFIQDLGPSKAGGASAAIYKFLGIAGQGSFPGDVTKGLTAELGAKLHKYGPAPAIHVVGRDFSQDPDLTPQKAMDSLTECYHNILREFAVSGLQRLRLLPVSGGLFSGHFHHCIAFMTSLALARGFALLESEHRQKILPTSRTCQARWVELCIYDPADVSMYEEAYRSVLEGDFDEYPELAGLPQLRTLFHGTSWENAGKIMSEGMALSKTGCLGKGAYFAEKDKAARFASCVKRHGGEPALVTARVSFASMKVVKKDDKRWQALHDFCYATSTSLSSNPEWCVKDPAQLTVMEVKHLDKSVSLWAWQRQQAEAARANGKQRDYEVDKYRDLKSLYRGPCMSLHHGPGAAGTCKGGHGWHFWCCHYCQTVQYGGACVNNCDWGTFGWTCIDPKCKGSDCGCRKGAAYWKEHGQVGPAGAAARPKVMGLF